MSDTIIRAKTWGKMYRIGAVEQRPASRWQRARQLAASPFAAPHGPPPEEETLLGAQGRLLRAGPARRGVGIIGRNGAGRAPCSRSSCALPSPPRVA